MPADKSHIAGIFCSDLHLCHKAPPARTAEVSWLKAQARVLDQLHLLKSKYNCPVYIAGDLLDRHDQPNWFVNWLILHLRVLAPKVIPGQHDIPNHQYTQLNRSAYWTLVEAGVIDHLTPGLPHEQGNLRVHAFPWNFAIKPPEKAHDLMLQVALIHAYVYTERTGYPGAPIEKLAAKYLPMLRGYDCAFFGDNHTGWFTKSPPREAAARQSCALFNCGILIRRLHGEQSYRPRVALLHASGVIEPYYLDARQDCFSPTANALESMSKTLKLNLSGFVNELANLRDTGYDWTATVRQQMDKHKFSPEVRKLILQSLGEIKEEIWPR